MVRNHVEVHHHMRHYRAHHTVMTIEQDTTHGLEYMGFIAHLRDGQLY
jgi:hypothetical protein